MEFHDLMVLQMLRIPIYDISYDCKTMKLYETSSN